MSYHASGIILEAIKWAEDNLAAIKTKMWKAKIMGSDYGNILYSSLEDEKIMLEELLGILRK
jgi:hypothetical protein